jgi:hypothetical protein
MIKVTVANVRKQSAQVFEMTSDGNLKFVASVVDGSACDLKLTAGRRYVAIFMDKHGGDPAIETFTAEKPDSIWLLRP